ncbi:Crp/Fnr family transcriptional regulator [Fibrivirga algicola]|uniref:Crp/Fnr family transcriptional regulator n=1 Tax=Fibrivirga algicola TaxID=2950420 RepID=A0ABX0QHD6_9BACT|nr:Crp/Fnr family transcriptional regulator [Fibrivirga algicola]ARK10352.1 cyclic nucleotide-binding protein [Fibrella sp. ES10-3-2-2]NID11861.1 Crp/Fnr family transcriptional regulator [Fibrivirga algicola]
MLANDLLTLRQQIERFTPLSDDEWHMLTPHVRVETIQKHQFFAEAGKQANEVALVLEGSFRHFYTTDGDEKTTYFYFEGHFISAYMSCITQTPSRLTIEALSPARYIVFPYTILSALFEKSITWQKFGRLIGEYIALGLEDRMVGLLTQSPEDRYLALLKSSKKKILDRIPQHYVANYLGITPVSLSRIRSRIMRRDDV